MTHELILGGQKSGKSRCAEQRAAAWLAQPGRSAVLIATALAGDDEMRQRIQRHREDRTGRVPLMATLEVPHDLPQALRRHAAADRLIVVDCLGMWLTNLLMPLTGAPLTSAAVSARRDGLCHALRESAGPIVLVSNEIGFGLSPMTRETRHFVDELGLLHQAMATRCDDVTLMVAGLELAVKRGASS